MNRPPPQEPYTKHQITQYLSHISFPNPTFLPTASLSFLARLVTYQLSCVPFENTKLHYSTLPLTPLAPYTQNRTPPLRPDALYTNIVERSRGGYCMELNAFFGHVLRSLGFKVSARGAKVHSRLSGDKDGDWFAGWSHMVNLVSIPGEERIVWLVDVGFGGEGPLAPVPVDYADENGEEPHLVKGIGQMEGRVRKFGTGIEGVMAKEEDVGQQREKRMYETRVKGKEDHWMPLYVFARHLEFESPDYEVMNWYVSTSPNSWFTKTLACVRFVRENEELVGVMILDGEVFVKRTGGEKVELRRCTTEIERADGLKRWFGLELSDNERAGIRGLPSALESHEV